MPAIHRNPGIYTLTDPRTHEVKYIGKGMPWISRSRIHLTPRPRRVYSHLPVYRWINKLIRLGLEPHIGCVQEFTTISKEDLCEAEIHWIKHFTDLGCKLLNCTAGGGGMLNPTPEWRKKRSEDAHKLKHTDTTKEKIAASKRGIPRSQSLKDKVSATLTGRKTGPMNDLHKKKISQAQPHATPIINNLGQIFCNQSKAASILNIRSKDINAVLRGRQKTAAGYSFDYFKARKD